MSLWTHSACAPRLTTFYSAGASSPLESFWGSSARESFAFYRPPAASARSGCSRSRKLYAVWAAGDETGPLTEEVGLFLECTPTNTEEAIYAALRLWRQIQAIEDNLPLYRVAYDHSLKDIARRLPESLDELSQVSGFGPEHLQRYGDRILKVIHVLCKTEGAPYQGGAH